MAEVLKIACITRTRTMMSLCTRSLSSLSPAFLRHFSCCGKFASSSMIWSSLLCGKSGSCSDMVVGSGVSARHHGNSPSYHLPPMLRFTPAVRLVRRSGSTHFCPRGLRQYSTAKADAYLENVAGQKGVATLTLDRPTAKNAISVKLLRVSFEMVYVMKRELTLS